MRLSDLTAYHLPERLLARWRERQGERLLPVQMAAIRKGLLELPVRMLIAAPTSSGKSFCAELAVGRALTERKRAVMLFPLKSLAEQKYHEVKQTLGPLGIKIIIATADHPEHDPAFFRGDYDLAVAIYEKFDQFLTARLDCLQSISLIVVDEIQSIGEPGRGKTVERLLTKLLLSPDQPSIIGLSAVLSRSGNAAECLAGWLGAVLVEEQSRPVDLYRGIATAGEFVYRSFNSGDEGREPFAPFNSEGDLLEAILAQLRADQGSSLVFLNSRERTLDAAFRLSASVRWPRASRAIAKLEREEPSFLVRSLIQALTSGVAFHNADLPYAQRMIIEKSFIDKEIRVIFATTTLAMGVNLAADRVYLESTRYAAGKVGGKPSLVPLSRAEFENMSGRAGRLAPHTSEAGPGRAVMLAETDLERDILWSSYIAPSVGQPLESLFHKSDLAEWLLNLAATGLISRAEPAGIGEMLSRSLAGYSGSRVAEADIEMALRRLVCDGWLVGTPDGRLEPTAAGEAVARTGLTLSQADYFRPALEQSYPAGPRGWLVLALSGPEVELPTGLVGRGEPVDEIRSRLVEGNFSEKETSLLGLTGSGRWPYRRLALAKGLLLMDDWRRGEPLQTLEQRYGAHLGQIGSLGETLAHLLKGIAALVVVFDDRTETGGNLERLAGEIRHGVPAIMNWAYGWLRQGINRGDLLALHRAGLVSPVHLMRESDERLQAAGISERKIFVIRGLVKSYHEEVEMSFGHVELREQRGPVPGRSRVQPELVEVDGRPDGERFLILIDGRPVRLTGKSFKYFAKLAWSRCHRDDGWIYKEDIEIGFNQARYLYRMKGELVEALNTAWPVVENNRLGYYRLVVDAGRIKLNESALRDHPDFEIRSMFGQAAHPAVN